MAPKLDKLHENFRRALAEAPLHSTLGRWMARHREELEVLFREGEPDWAAMAEHFGRTGLRDEADRRPTAESAEHTWRMVREHGQRGAAAGRATPRQLPVSRS